MSVMRMVYGKVRYMGRYCLYMSIKVVGIMRQMGFFGLCAKMSLFTSSMSKIVPRSDGV